MSESNLNEEIITLSNKYYGLICRDHHKDRDCHFYINTIYSYGNPPYYMVEHYGYVYDLQYVEKNKKYNSYTEAQVGLIEILKIRIAREETYTFEE